MKIIKLIIVIALFLIALALGAENQSVISFNYLVAQGEFHLSTLLGIVFFIGFVFSGLLFGSLLLNAQLRIKRLNKKLKVQNKANTKLLEKTE